MYPTADYQANRNLFPHYSVCRTSLSREPGECQYLATNNCSLGANTTIPCLEEKINKIKAALKRRGNRRQFFGKWIPNVDSSSTLLRSTSSWKLNIDLTLVAIAFQLLPKKERSPLAYNRDSFHEDCLLYAYLEFRQKYLYSIYTHK